MSGLLLVASFAPFSCATLSWIALVPAWWMLTRNETVRKHPFRHGYLVGLIYFGGVFWWIGNVTVIGTMALIAYLALYPAVWFLLVARLPFFRKPGHGFVALGQAVAGGALWVFLEWWRSWFLSGFNWNELGHAQAPSLIFRQLAAYGGVPLISFVLVTVNILWAEGILAMAETLRHQRVVRPSISFGTALLIVAFCFALGWHHVMRHSHETAKIGPAFACVQPGIPQIPYDGGPIAKFQKREADALQTEKELSYVAIAKQPELLLWPESITDAGVFQDRELNTIVHDICLNFPGYFLLGSEDFDTQARKLYNCAYFFTPHGDQYASYRKTQLVILGEYLPFGDTFPWLRKAVGMGMDFSRGSGPVNFVLKQSNVTLSPLICFEDTLSGVVDRAAKLRPDAFVTITNDGWYWGWCARWGLRQHLAQAIFRCVEHDRPMIRCANNGISCLIDQDGTVVDRFRDLSGNEIDARGIFTGTLRFYPPHSTRYEAWGSWIVLISEGVVAMLIVHFFLCLFVPASRES